MGQIDVGAVFRYCLICLVNTLAYPRNPFPFIVPAYGKLNLMPIWLPIH